MEKYFGFAKELMNKGLYSNYQDQLYDNREVFVVVAQEIIAIIE